MGMMEKKMEAIEYKQHPTGGTCNSQNLYVCMGYAY